MKELSLALAGIVLCLLVAGVSGCGGGGSNKIASPLSYETTVNVSGLGYVESFDITLHNESDISRVITLRSQTIKDKVSLYITDNATGETSTFSHKGSLGNYGQEVDTTMYTDGVKWYLIEVDPRIGVSRVIGPKGQMKLRLAVSKG